MFPYAYRRKSKNTSRMTERITVRTSCGKIQGITRKSKFSGKTYYSFLGIPYALPPVNELRFRPPQPVPRWRDVYDATYQRDECIHYTFYDRTLIGSEDCLYLNVHIPTAPDKNSPLKAVVVLIHQGGFAWGAGTTRVNGSPTYVMHTDIIYVTFNYRLHVLGFLNLNIRECPGNFGLKDIIAALQWVQQNIKSFGGDPNNVTLIGNSSGSMVVHWLMMTPQAKGLFHKAIALGMYMQHPFINFQSNHEERAVELGKLLDFKGSGLLNLLKFLRHQPIGYLLTASKTLSDKMVEENKLTIITSPFMPAICSFDRFLPNPPSEYAAFANPVPVIFGVVENEGSFSFIRKTNRFVNDYFPIVFRQNAWGWLGKTNDVTISCIENEVRKFYCDETRESFPNRTQTDVIIAEFYDTWANVMEKFHPDCPVYVYRFEYIGDLNYFTEMIRDKSKYNFKGNCHGEDMLYWMCRKAEPNEDDASVVRMMTKLFSDFAKTGNPTNEDAQTKWRNSTMEAPCYLRINKELTLVNEKINENSTQFWTNLKMKYSERENACVE